MMRPAAFMSYAHRDDTLGRLTQLRQRLSAVVGMHIGEDFEIFQDRNAIFWGQNWKERIQDSLDEVTFLIAIITPSFFRSSHCRTELRRFIDRQETLGRRDLILPIYYVPTPLMDDEAMRATDELAQIIATRQYVDWRDLRNKSFGSQRVNDRLEQLGAQIRAALDRVREGEDRQNILRLQGEEHLMLEIVERGLEIYLTGPGVSWDKDPLLRYSETLEGYQLIGFSKDAVGHNERLFKHFVVCNEEDVEEVGPLMQHPKPA